MVNRIWKWLNDTTMYRVVIWMLLAQSLVGVGLSFVGVLPFSGWWMILSLVVCIVGAWGSDVILSRFLKESRGVESAMITGLIMFLVMNVPRGVDGVVFNFFASVLAVLGKSFFTVKGKHVFNPAALAMFLIGLFGSPDVYWWVGSFAMLPICLVTGALIVLKVQRMKMVGLFFVVAVLSVLVRAYFQIGFNDFAGVYDVIGQMFWSWPTLFFATVMLTEPLTSPGTKIVQVVYAVLVGLLYGLNFHFDPVVVQVGGLSFKIVFYATPEFALLIGNLFKFLTENKLHLKLKLKAKEKIGRGIWDFVFERFDEGKKIGGEVFRAGQYAEWTVKAGGDDNRGNRRYFTIASSPTEKDFRLGLRVQEGLGSRFKSKLLKMKIGDEIFIDQIGGDFCLDLKRKNRKYLFVAGGIGITPFRSMAKDLIDKGEKIDAVLLYFCGDVDGFAYGEELKMWSGKNGVKVIEILGVEKNDGWKGEVGRLNEDLLKKVCPDFAERVVYISGPNAMVSWYKNLLKELGVKKFVLDYFPGF